MAAVTGNVAAKRSQSLRLLVESAEFQVTFPDIKRAVANVWYPEGYEGERLGTAGACYTRCPMEHSIS
jgi:hypothetical protein